MQSDVSLKSGMNLYLDLIYFLARKYSGIIDCISKTYRLDGISAFYRGFSAAMYRSFPANAFCFLGYEAAASYLRPKFSE